MSQSYATLKEQTDLDTKAADFTLQLEGVTIAAVFKIQSNVAEGHLNRAEKVRLLYSTSWCSVKL